MWRFVLISFVFMGLAFYELSGGADYEPAANSLQVQARLPDSERFDKAAHVSAAAETETSEPKTLAEVEAVMDQLRDAEEETHQLSVTLAAARTDAAGIFELEASRPKAELLTMELPEIRQEGADSIEAAVAAALGEVTFDDTQVRWVKEAMIDLRSGPGLTFDRVMQLPKGTEVAVLEDPGHGWLNVQVIDNYQTGWVAEWLLIEPE